MKILVTLIASLILNTSFAQCLKIKSSQVMGSISNSRLQENSGIDFSRKHSGVFWAHNDANNGVEIFALDMTGRTLAEVTIEGAENKDWEDLSVASCFYDSSKDCIYIADIGNNEMKRKKMHIYVVEEPSDLLVKSLPIARKISLPMPELNFEAFAMNEKTFDFYVISKGGKKALVKGESTVFSFRENSIGLQPLVTIDFTTMPGIASKKDTTVTSADFDSASQTLLLGTYGVAWEVALADLGNFRSKARLLPMPKMEQSEAIAYYTQGGAVQIATTAEGLNQPLYLLSCGN